jgi:hypothetical protein
MDAETSAAYLQTTYGGGEEAVFGGGSAPSESVGFERDFAAELDRFLATGGGSVPVIDGPWKGEPKSGGTLEALLASIGGDDDVSALVTDTHVDPVTGGDSQPSAVLVAAPALNAAPVVADTPAANDAKASTDISDLVV